MQKQVSGLGLAILASVYLELRAQQGGEALHTTHSQCLQFMHCMNTVHSFIYSAHQHCRMKQVNHKVA